METVENRRFHRDLEASVSTTPRLGTLNKIETYFSVFFIALFYALIGIPSSMYLASFYSLSLPGTTVRRSGSTTIITNGRNGNNTMGQNASRMSTTNRNQLDPSPQELPVKDTDRAIDVASAECKSRDYLHFPLFGLCACPLHARVFLTTHDHLVVFQSVSMQDCKKP